MFCKNLIDSLFEKKYTARLSEFEQLVYRAGQHWNWIKRTMLSVYGRIKILGCAQHVKELPLEIQYA